MHDIHRRLRETFPWYDRWHNDVHSNTVTWGIFLLVALTYTSVLLSTITIAHIDIDSSEQIGSVGAALTRAADRGPKGDGNVERLRLVSDEALMYAGEHVLAGAGEKTPSLEKLKTSLKKRQDTIRELALVDPKAVRRFVFDELVLQSIPEAARNLVEKPFEKTGTYHIALVTEEFSELGEKSHEEYLLEVSPSEMYRLALTEEEAYSIVPEKKVKVIGVQVASGVIIPTAEVEQDDSGPSVLGASTVKKLAVVAFNFRNNTTQLATVDELRNRFFSNSTSIAAHIRENSSGMWDVQGRDRIDGDIYGWITLDEDVAGSCDYSGWASRAGQAITAAGGNLSGYTNIQYVFPSTNSGCGWSGLAYMPGSTSWVMGGVGSGVSAHELGHNYGFHHAASYGCTTANSTVGLCSGSEYGDPYDPMGGAKLVHHANINKAKFWYQPSQSVTATQSGTYTLESDSLTGTGVKALRIKRPYSTGSVYEANGYYVLEYRTADGFDTGLGAAAVNAVTVRLVADGYTTSTRKTYLVRTIPVGTTYTDSEGGVAITVASTSAQGAVVNIDMQVAPCVRNNPQVTVAPSGQWGAAGGSLNYTLTLKNIDGDTCSASDFTVTPTLPTGFTQTPSTLGISTLPGETKSVSFGVSSPMTAIPATYTFSEVAQNTVDSAKTATVQGNYNIAAADVTPPTVTISSPLNGAVLKGSKVAVSANASDVSGIARIELSIDGAVVKSCSAVTVCTYNVTLRKVTVGTHTIKAIAIDNSPQQNRTETSITVTK